MNYLNKFLFFISIIFAFLFVFTPLQPSQAANNVAQQVRSPAFLQVNQTTEQKENVIAIKGTTAPNTEVLIYIDGSYADNADIKQLNKDTFIFDHTYKEPLSAGEHNIMAVAQDKSSNRLSPPKDYSLVVKDSTKTEHKPK